MISSAVMEIHTPVTPNRWVNTRTVMTRTPHMVNRLMKNGALLSPAPRSAPVATMLTANSGSEKATIRRSPALTSATSVSAVRRLVRKGAKPNIKSAMKNTRMEPKIVVP